MKVWVIEDEKYGVQGVYATEELALEADKDDAMSPSGFPTSITEWEVEAECES